MSEWKQEAAEIRDNRHRKDVPEVPKHKSHKARVFRVLADYTQDVGFGSYVWNRKGETKVVGKYATRSGALQALAYHKQGYFGKYLTNFRVEKSD